MYLSNLVSKSHSIFIRMDDIMFRATWDETGNVGVVNMTKAELKEFTSGTCSDKGEQITSTLKRHLFYWYRAYCQKSDEKS